MENTGKISFSIIVVQKGDSDDFYGMVREVDGIVVKGHSEKEVIKKTSDAIAKINRAKKKASIIDDLIGKKPDFKVVREFEQTYAPEQ